MSKKEGKILPIHYLRMHYYKHCGCGIPAKNLKSSMTATTHRKVTCIGCLEYLYKVKLNEAHEIRCELKLQREIQK